MSPMTLYHGSTEVVEQPVFGKGKAGNDYGKGFYCTEDREAAMEWACSRNSNGYCNRYTIDIDGLKILDLNSLPALSWFAVLVSNRHVTLVDDVSRQNLEYIKNNFMINTEEYDIIRGWRADDRYFSAVRRFMNNTMGLGTFEKALRLGEFGEQVVIKSETAFERIRFTGVEPASADVCLPRYIERMTKADEMLAILEKNTDYTNEVFALDIVRQKMRRDDPRLLRTVPV